MTTLEFVLWVIFGVLPIFAASAAFIWRLRADVEEAGKK